MKKLLLAAAASLLLVSCDFIFKDTANGKAGSEPEKKIVLGTDKDENGCVTSAGYKWSAIKEECTRIFDEGYRLNPVEKLEDASAAQSAFVIFEDGGDRAELFLPNAGAPVMLARKNKNSHYKGSGWSLELESGYTLKKGGQPVYAGAAIEEGRITGDDSPEG